MGENNNLLDNFRSYIDKKPILKRPDIKKDNIDMTSKSFDTRSHTRNILSRRTF